MAGLDTETSSLEYKADQIAGVCVSGGMDYSPQGYAGYYIPLRHIGYGANLPVDTVMEFVQWLIDNFQTVLFNRNFDTSMLEYDGVKIPFVGGMHDAQIMAYSVFNEAYPSLKDYSRRFLKWDMIDFAENKAKDHNFKTTDPTVSYIYAAGDPIATVFLARKLWSTYPYIRKIYKIDNYCLEAVRRLCQNELTLDYDFLEALRDETERHLAEIRTKIYSMSGVYGFNIDSSREKADVLSRFVTLTEKTKSGKFKTDEEALRRLNHPIANLMIDYAQTRVFLKSFVAKMCTYKGRVIRANYNTVNVPSGRLSSGASEGNPYFVPQNMQNCPKEEEKLYLHHHPKIGYVLLREEEGCVRNAKGEPVKHKTKTGLHRAFIPHDKDWVIMSSDYAAQELRLAANFSRDPNFLEPLLKGDDIHMHVAKQMFGYEDPLHRTKVKIVNFCLGEDSYVMTDSGIVRPASLKGDERLLKVFGGTQSYRMEVRLSDTVKVHYSNGVVEEYDSRHQVAVTSDKGLTWKRVCDLTEDDEVLISVGRMKETSSPLIERIGTYRKFSVSREKEYNLSTKEFAYLAGLYLGDGHISLGKQGRPNSVSWVAEEQIYPLVEECLTKLGLKWSIHTYEGKNYRLYRVHSSQFARVLSKHFGRTKTKTISDGVLSAWGKDLFIPLCQGLVDSDGTLHGNVLVYFTCLDELAKKVALVLSGLGIYVRERVADHNCHHLRMSENDVVQSNLDRKRWGSGRPLLDFRKYDRSILEGLSGGFENGRVDNMRRGKCGLWVKSSLVEKAGYSGLRPVSVVGVSKPKTGKIYVIETETGSYVSSSVVSHNSALYGAEYPTISARLGIPLQEGKSLMTRYKQTMSKLYAWKAEIVKAAKKRGYALTYFGRPVYLLKYFNSPDRGMSAYAERLAVNATIQGCLPADTFAPSQDGKVISTLRNLVGKRVQFAKDERGTAHKGVPVFRGKLPCAMVEFLSGDFIMVSTNHKFLKYKSNTLLSIEEAAADAVQFVKPNKKVKLLKAILNTLLGRFKGTTLNSLAVFPRHDKPADSVEIATALFRAFIRDEHLITYNPVLAHSVRSLVDLYGYNLVKVCPGRYALSWSRAKKSKVCFVDNLKGTYDVMSPTMISGFQTYPLSGMIHKNTGADLMRLFLIKFTKLNIDDKDWRENTRMILPVHDEMNLEVSIPYMREAWLKMRKVMNFFPENFAVPIVVDTGVGTSWGNCLDVECISPKGRVVPKDIDPDDFSGEERAYLQEILEECIFEELPDRLKKFVKC